MEAFSNGVFAIAITHLELDLLVVAPGAVSQIVLPRTLAATLGLHMTTTPSNMTSRTFSRFW
jgi:hypothetical protein